MNRRSFFKMLGMGVVCPSFILSNLKPRKNKNERLIDLMRKAFKNTKFRKPVYNVGMDIATGTGRSVTYIVYDEFAGGPNDNRQR